MAKHRGNASAVADNPTPEVKAAEVTTETAPASPGPNFTLVYRREHPQNRSSYGIAGVSGIVVFDNGLFAGGERPATITLDCELVQPKPDTKALKAQLAAERLAERAAKAQARIEAAQAKAIERQAKADAALAKAKARLEAAKASAVTKVEDLDEGDEDEGDA